MENDYRFIRKYFKISLMDFGYIEEMWPDVMEGLETPPGAALYKCVWYHDLDSLIRMTVHRGPA